jgi:MFS family permease
MSASGGHSTRQRAVLLTGLYAAQGLPYGFFSLALPVLLRDAGWSLTAIGFLHLLGLPWGIKFLWAPLLDQKGSRRSWLLFFQFAACAMALLLSQLNLEAGSLVLFGAILVFNLIAASQDIVTDGLAVRLLGAQERGLANAIQVGAFRLGMILGGGLLLWLFAQTGWRIMFLAMAALLALTILPVLSLQEAPRPAAPERRTQGWSLLVGWLHRAMAPGMMRFAALIFCYRFGDQLLNALIPPFLLDHGVSKATIALMKGAVGSGTSLLGASIGGWLVWQWGRRKALLFAGLAQAAGFSLYIAVAYGLGGETLLWVVTVLEGIVGTMATVALFTLMMDASDPEHAGTDYTLLASVVVAITSMGSLAGGFLGDRLGYGPTFILASGLALAGTLFVVWRLDRAPVNARLAEAWR